AHPALALARPLIVQPVPGSTLSSNPYTVRVGFSEDFFLERSFIHVSDQSGQSVTRGPARREPGMTLAIDLNTSGSNLYTVDWQVATQPAGDVDRGRFQFRVSIPGSPAPTFQSVLPTGFGQPRPGRALMFPGVDDYHAERNLTNGERAILARNLPAAERQLSFAIDSALGVDDTEILAPAYRLRAFVRATRGDFAGAADDTREAAYRGT